MHWGTAPRRADCGSISYTTLKDHRCRPTQSGLEADYRRILADNYGIRFNRLLALANLPIQRFGSTLLSLGQFDDYMALLKQAHQDDNLHGVMCR